MMLKIHQIYHGSLRGGLHVLSSKFLTIPSQSPQYNIENMHRNKRLISAHSIEKKKAIISPSWFEKASKIPTSKIVPGHSNNNKSTIPVKVAAWYGDKVIGGEVAKQLYMFMSTINECNNKELQSTIYKIHNIAVSNKVLCDSVSVVLPSHDTSYVNGKVHAAGTMVEAPVSEVATGPTSNSIESLAKYFILKASLESMDLPNNIKKKLVRYFRTEQPVMSNEAKSPMLKPTSKVVTLPNDVVGALIKLGGKVDCYEKSRHPIVHCATAQYNTLLVTMEASRKKRCETFRGIEFVVTNQCQQQQATYCNVHLVLKVKKENDPLELLDILISFHNRT